MPGPPSWDALLQAADVDAGAGVQLCAPGGLASTRPTRPVLVRCEGGALPDSALRHYPADAEAWLVREVAGELRREPVEVATLRDAGLGDAVAVLLPAVPSDAVRYAVDGVRGVIDRLRDPDGGCPWDLEQDHQSLRPHLLEETYEVLHALDLDDPRVLREELGDLLMQIVLHAKIAEQAGEFDLDDVSEGIRAKLVRRHPHVFADGDARTPDEVTQRWDQIKAEERAADASALDGVPRALPALQRAQSLTGRADRAGFAWPSDADLLRNITEELGEIAQARDADERRREFGDLVFAVADYARRNGVQLEDAVRETAEKFERRFRAVETELRAQGRGMDAASREEQLALWNATKSAERPSASGA